MSGRVTHDRREESIEAKTRWFSSLPLSERMELFCEFTELALAANPDLLERKRARPTTGTVQVISRK